MGRPRAVHEASGPLGGLLRGKHSRVGGDQNEAQLIAEAQQLLPQLVAAVEFDLGVEGRADVAGRPQLLQLLADRFPHTDQLAPEGAVEGVVGGMKDQPMYLENTGHPVT